MMLDTDLNLTWDSGAENDSPHVCREKDPPSRLEDYFEFLEDTKPADIHLPAPSERVDIQFKLT